MSRPHALTLALALTGWLVAGYLAFFNTAAAAPPSPTAAWSATAAAAPLPVPIEIDEATARLLKNMWWNSPQVVSTLPLGPEQRALMDNVFAAFQDRRQRLRANPADVQKRYAQALRRGDLAGARTAVQIRAERAAALATAEAEMVLNVLGQLDREQLARLGDTFPAVLERPWIKQIGGDRPRGPRRRSLRPPPREPRPASGAGAPDVPIPGGG